MMRETHVLVTSIDAQKLYSLQIHMNGSFCVWLLWNFACRYLAVLKRIRTSVEQEPV